MRIIKNELFELNPRRRIREKIIGQGRHRILIIDDYWKRAKEIAQLFNELWYSADDDVRCGSPAYRSFINLPYKRLGKELFQLHFPYYEKKSMSNHPWGFDQYFDRLEEFDFNRAVPHVDNHKDSVPYYALVIYMNEQNLHGGTQFLRRLDQNIERYDKPMQSYALSKVRPDNPWQYYEDEFHRYHLEPMRFNKLISYRSDLIHAPYTNGRFYRDNPRKIISGFF